MNLKKETVFLFKWIFISVLIGVFSGCASALFLVSLDWITLLRENNTWVIWLLPFVGLCIGLFYHYYGNDVVKGNNLLLEEYETTRKIIPLKMAPMVLIGTLATHLVGGSAGREGTAVQMGGSIADQFAGFFNLDNNDRKTVIILGISAGFASVFGTPLAGAFFALELFYFSKISFKSIILSFITVYIAYFTVEIWQVKHTHYYIPIVPRFTATNFLWILICGILFGLTAMLFSRSIHFWGKLFSKFIKYPPLKPLIGGIILVVLFQMVGTNKYNGLGIPSIVASFSTSTQWFDFLLKILFTGLTIGSGFKGGEVTPLFFVGASLGSFLSLYFPLPIALLAGMGFVAVFSGATHTPIACTIMGMELFGIESGLYIGLSCLVAYFFSGSIGIYQSQNVQGPKSQIYQFFTSRKKIDL
jgi:H+/Cl- antiporter ClcA